MSRLIISVGGALCTAVFPERAPAVKLSQGHGWRKSWKECRECGFCLLELLLEKRILRIYVYQCHPVLFLVIPGECLQTDVCGLKGHVWSGAPGGSQRDGIISLVFQSPHPFLATLWSVDYVTNLFLLSASSLPGGVAAGGAGEKPSCPAGPGRVTLLRDPRQLSFLCLACPSLLPPSRRRGW